MSYTVFYVMSNRKNGRVRMGVTTNPWQQIAHQQENGLPFLVHYEIVVSIAAGLDRKDNWLQMTPQQRRSLISVVNPQWSDLCSVLYCEIGPSGKTGSFAFEAQEWW